MAQTLPDRLGARPRKMVSDGFATALKKLEEPDVRRALGRVIDRAFDVCSLTKKDVADRLGYTNQSAIARWVQGTEPPQMARLLAIDEYRRGFLIALAETDELVVAKVILDIPLTVRRGA